VLPGSALDRQKLDKGPPPSRRPVSLERAPGLVRRWMPDRHRERIPGRAVAARPPAVPYEKPLDASRSPRARRIETFGPWIQDILGRDVHLRTERSSRSLETTGGKPADRQTRARAYAEARASTRPGPRSTQGRRRAPPVSAHRPGETRPFLRDRSDAGTSDDSRCTFNAGRPPRPDHGAARRRTRFTGGSRTDTRPAAAQRASGAAVTGVNLRARGSRRGFSPTGPRRWAKRRSRSTEHDQLPFVRSRASGQSLAEPWAAIRAGPRRSAATGGRIAHRDLIRHDKPASPPDIAGKGVLSRSLDADAGHPSSGWLRSSDRDGIQRAMRLAPKPERTLAVGRDRGIP